MKWRKSEGAKERTAKKEGKQEGEEEIAVGEKQREKGGTQRAKEERGRKEEKQQGQG